MPRIYHELASLWPLLSPPADYAPEAAQVRAVLRVHAILPRLSDPNPEKPSLMELGAGGGHTLSHLSADLDCTGVDLSPEMLAVSQQLNPACEHIEGDMRTLRLNRTFDCVLIHDAIDYMTTPEDARAAVATAAAHTKPGGMTIIAPTYVAETFTDHEGELDVNTSPEGLEVAFLSRVHRLAASPHQFELAMLLMMRDAAGQLTIEEDRHTCGLFSVEDWLGFMREADYAALVTSFCLDEDEDLAGTTIEPDLVPFSAKAEFPRNIPWFFGVKL